LSPNIIIPIQHQSAPTLRYDAGAARAAAEQRDPKEAKRRDWDEHDYRAARGFVARRRAMQNQDFDREFWMPGHDDPAIALLERPTDESSRWVEQNLELYEQNIEASKPQRLADQERWQKEHEAARLVNVLHPSAVMRKLRDAGVDARDFEHPNARIWLNDFSRAGLVGVNAWVTPDPMDEEGYLLELKYAESQRARDIITDNYQACRAGRKVRRTLTSLQEGYGPEWSVMRFNEHQVATKEKYRGWRTAMLVLICAGILTEEEVDRAFGPPTGEAAAFYRQTLKNYRQIKLGRAV
jgi:hypothetical protein